ncbi:hypothetical protein PVAND_003633 [Polypedilum vanderplanki]|uniref:G-protein coupled receptors family 1 profile domain-containing protein n=1 Tax=Polypedilum vanderplanki TaxID=319348 RepID=A0A9J6BUN1_POLVA|nr:hypothetical protein PVAND_003633 [Polypedilum vanderplanki]
MESDCLLENKCFKEISEQSSFNASSFSDIAIAFHSEDNVKQLLISMHHDQTTNSDGNNENNESILSLSNVTTAIVNATQCNDIYEAKFADLIFAILFCLLIIVTVIGNTLVILSVLTTRRLRTVTNCFVMSLAVADWLVGIFVMPPAVAYYLIGCWHLGWILCDIWISLDVLLCTASILSLCAISIDRYLAVTQPLNYSRRRRSKRLAMLMILIVWVLALAITCPPILGWYEPGRREEEHHCRYNENKGYVVFSAMGSFFIPMLVMVYVYLRISCVVASRHDDMVQIKVHQNSSRTREICVNDFDCESENENRGCSASTRKLQQKQQTRAGDEVTVITTNKKNSPILPDQDLVKTFENLDEENSIKSTRNGHYELIHIGKIPSEPSIKYNSTTKSSNNKEYSHCCRSNNNSDKSNDFINQQHQQTVSLTKINSNNNSENSIINQQLGSTNFYILRTRTQTKSLSTRISSLKRESKTTRTLSIVMFTFIACWLPFFINYIAKPFLAQESMWRNETLEVFLTWLGWSNSSFNFFIYAFWSEDFRAAFYRLTLRKFCITAKKKPYAYPLASLSTRR